MPEDETKTENDENSESKAGSDAPETTDGHTPTTDEEPTSGTVVPRGTQDTRVAAEGTSPAAGEETPATDPKAEADVAEQVSADIAEETDEIGEEGPAPESTGDFDNPTVPDPADPTEDELAAKREMTDAEKQKAFEENPNDFASESEMSKEDWEKQGAIPPLSAKPAPPPAPRKKPEPKPTEAPASYSEDGDIGVLPKPAETGVRPVTASGVEIGKVIDTTADVKDAEPESNYFEGIGIEPDDDLGTKLTKIAKWSGEQTRNEAVTLIQGTLNDGRAVLRELFKEAKLDQKTKERIATVYASAEDLAAQGHKDAAEQMLIRVNNYLASDEVIAKTNKMEAVSDFWNDSLGMVANLARSFIGKAKTPLLAAAGYLLKDIKVDLFE